MDINGSLIFLYMYMFHQFPVRYMYLHSIWYSFLGCSNQRLQNYVKIFFSLNISFKYLICIYAINVSWYLSYYYRRTINCNFIISFKSQNLDVCIQHVHVYVVWKCTFTLTFHVQYVMIILNVQCMYSWK